MSYYSSQYSQSNQSIRIEDEIIQETQYIPPHFQENKNAVEEQYSQFFGPILQDIQKMKKQNITKQALERHKIRILDQNDLYWGKLINYGGVYVQTSGDLFHGLECRYDVVIGNFYLTIHVLNIHRNAQIANNRQGNIGEGSFGIVKLVIVQGKKIAVKRILFDQSKKSDVFIPYIYESKDRCEPYQIRQAVKQYCIYKICSMLKIGPQLIFDDVYDLVCYNDGIQFQMELCQLVGQKVNNSYQNDIKQCVAMLHDCKFVHKDLKPLNTLYSPSLGKYVMSDFGITHSVKQSINQKTQTYFQGSYHYTSPQMKQLYDDKKIGFVNLYYNDIHCLMETFNELRKIKMEVNADQFSRNSMSIDQYANQDQYQSGNYHTDNYDNNSYNDDYNNNYGSNEYSGEYDDNSYEKYRQNSNQSIKMLKNDDKSKRKNQQNKSSQIKKTNQIKQSQRSKQSQLTDGSSASQGRLTAQQIEMISKDYQNSYLSTKFLKEDIIKYSIEINFYQSRVIYQILKQESQKKQMSVIQYMFSKSKYIKDIKQNIRKNDISKLIQQKVNKICNHQQKLMIVEVVLIFVENLLNNDNTYYKQIMQIRNTIRIFGLYSQQTIEKLKDLLIRKQIPNYNYTQLKTNIQVLQKYKEPFTQRKMDTFCNDLIRHNRLFNQKSLRKSFRQIIRQSQFLKQDMPIEKKKTVLIAGMTLLDGRQIDTNFILQIKKCMLTIFNPVKWKNQNLEKALIIKQRNKSKKQTNVQLRSQLLQLMYKIIEQQNLLSNHFIMSFLNCYQALQKDCLSSKFLLQKIGQSWKQLQNQKFEDFSRNQQQQKQMNRLKQKYIQTLNYFIEGLMTLGYFEQAFKIISQKLPIVQKCPITFLKLLLYERFILIVFGRSQFELTQKYNQIRFKLLKQYMFPKINTFQFVSYYDIKGDLHFHQQKFRQAIQAYEKVLTILLASINSRQEGQQKIIQIYDKQGQCSIFLGQYAKAQQYYEQALKHCFIYKTGYTEEKLDFLSAIVRLNMLQGKTQKLPKLFDQIVILRIQHINQIGNGSADEKTNFKNYQRMLPVFLFDQAYHGTDEIVVHAKKVLIASMEPYLPVFIWNYRQYCEEIAQYYVKHHMPSKALPFLWKYFFNQPHQLRVYNDIFFKKVDYFAYLLINAHCGRRSIKILQKYAFIIPIQFLNDRAEIFKKLNLLSKDFSTTIYNFYNIIWKNHGYRSQQNKQQCLKQIQLIPNKFLRKIFVKKLALLKFQNDQTAEKDSKKTYFSLHISEYQDEIPKIYNQEEIQKQIETQISNSVMETQDQSELQIQNSQSKYQPEQFRLLIKNKIKAKNKISTQ